MANVDLVDLIPILKAIRNIKREYKQAIQTEYDDFSLYPVLTENFLDTCYNNGYVVGFKQCLEDNLCTSDDIVINLPREMRELVPATFSDSGDANYDTLTSIMSFCLAVRQDLKTILDLDTDLFELYPPQVTNLGSSQFVAGYNDGYIGGSTYVSNLIIAPPTINYINNRISLSHELQNNNVRIRYKLNSLDGNWIDYNYGEYITIDEDTTIYAYATLGTKNSEINSRFCEYTDFYAPTFTFANNRISIITNYSYESGVVTMYRLSNWTDLTMWREYNPSDGSIPISVETTISAYNTLGEQKSTTTIETFTPTEETTTRPATPQMTFSSQNNILSITCATQGATIYYKKEGSDIGWIQYVGPINLVESGTYKTISSLNGVESLESDALTCVVSTSSGGVTPTSPSVYTPNVICNSNKIIAFTTQSGVSLYLMKTSGEFDTANNYNLNELYLYSGPVSISKDSTWQAKAVLNSDSNIFAWSVPVNCKYSAVAPGSGSGGTSTDPYVAAPIISCNSNIVSISAITAGSTIKYKRADSNDWLDYTEPFSITESFLYEAVAVKDGYQSSVNKLFCNYSSTPPGPDPGPDPVSYESQYLTIEITEPDGAYIQTSETNTIYYKVNYEDTWHGLRGFESSTGSYPKSLQVNYGDIVIFCSNYDNSNTAKPRRFIVTKEIPSSISSLDDTTPKASFIVYGNVLSLDKRGSDFINTNVASSDMTFINMFYGQKVTNAQNLVMPKWWQPGFAYRGLYCKGMFKNCSYLTLAPQLPGLDLQSNCYEEMFMGCTSLSRAPELPAAQVGNSCYKNMFKNCTSLNYVKCLALTTINNLTSFDSAFEGWLNGVPETGTFVKNSSAPAEISDFIPEEWQVQSYEILYSATTGNFDDGYSFSNNVITFNPTLTSGQTVLNVSGFYCDDASSWCGKKVKEYTGPITITEDTMISMKGVHYNILYEPNNKELPYVHTAYYIP